MLHIASSIVVLLVIGGLRTKRQVHIGLGIAFCSLRTINTITSWML